MPLYAILSTIAQMDDDLINQINDAIQSVGLAGAYGWILDFYARRVGLYRFTNENDVTFYQRILAQFSRKLDPQSLTKYLQLYNDKVYGIYELGGNSVSINKQFKNYNYTRQIIPARFSRASTAYTINGQQVSNNIPVFVPVPRGQAVSIWQSVTNLLTANQSSVETDLTGFTAVNGAALARDSSYAWHGSYSIKVVTPGIVTGEGVKVSLTGSANTVYTGSLRIMGSGTIQVQIVDTTNQIYGTTKTITLTHNWQTVNDFNVFCAGGNVDFLITTASAQSTTFWIDGLQVEIGLYSSPWVLGGSTKAIETLTYPVQSGLSFSQGCIRVALLQHQATYDSYTYRYVFSHSTGNNQNVLAIRHTPDNCWQVWVSDASGNSDYANVPDRAVQAFPGGSMYASISNLITFAVNWSTDSLDFYINGIKMATINSPHLPSVWASNIYIGSWIDGTGQANGEVFKLDLSQQERQDIYISTYDAIVDDTALSDGLSWLKTGYVTNDLTAYAPSNYEGAAFYLDILGATSQNLNNFYNLAYYDNNYFFNNPNMPLQQYINKQVLNQCKVAGVIPIFT